MSISISGAGLSGIMRGVQGVSRASAEIASPESFENRTKDLTSALVSLQQAQSQVQAATKAVSHQDQALGSLIDITA